MFLSHKIREKLIFALASLMLFAVTVCFFPCFHSPALITVFLAMLFLSLVLPLYSAGKKLHKKIKACNYGVKLLVSFSVTLPFTIAVNLVALLSYDRTVWWYWVVSALVAILAEAATFWIGIICVYVTSTQLGIKLRVLGAVFGLVPIVNLIFLVKIIRTASHECSLETEKDDLNAARKDDRICATKYPILLVHGVFFRDISLLNYWGRIPAELEKNGAQIYYGNHQSASSVEDSAIELSNRIEEIVEKTGCEKLNIIAHSKGGLDCRHLLAHHKSAEYVASLTTINTPHRGCMFADYLLNHVSEAFKNRIAGTYNSAMRKLGDTSPDFIAAVENLTSKFCKEFDSATPTPENVYCQSVGSTLKRASSGKFPLNFTYHLAKHFDGANDGLVGEDSFRFGENYTLLTPNGKRGISHGDMIDLNRENIKSFDVREFYVNLVSRLKSQGL